MAFSGGLSFMSPSSSLAVWAMRGSSSACSRVGGGMRWAASHWRRGRAMGSRPNRLERTLVPVRGRPTMIHGLSMVWSPMAGWSCAQRWSSMRLARAALSILVIRMRPNVVSSASDSHADRNTASGSR